METTQMIDRVAEWTKGDPNLRSTKPTEAELISAEKQGLPQFVRITSGGMHAMGFDIKVELEDGRQLPCTADIKIDIPLDGCPRATIEFPLPRVDIVTTADIFVTTIAGKRYRLYPAD